MQASSRGSSLIAIIADEVCGNRLLVSIRLPQSLLSADFFFVVLVGAFVGIRVSSGGLCRGDGIARIEVYVVEAVSFWCCFAFCDVGSEAFFAYCSAPAGIGSRIRVS